MAPGVPEFDQLHSRFSLVCDYLARIAPAGKLPGRQHFDPLAVGPRIIPFINLVDVIRDEPGLRFRFRLVGSRQSDIAGREITGKLVEDAVLPEFVDRIKSNMRAVVQSKTPVYDAFPMPHPKRDFIRTERIYFPLASDGELVDMILIVNGYPELRE